MTGTAQLWVLLAPDPETGGATLPVGVLGLAGDDHHVSWIPLTVAAAWRERLRKPSSVPLAERLAFWVEHANGRTVDLEPLGPAPVGTSLHDTVESALDELLAAGVGE